MSSRESIMPTFALSERSKADLVWLSRETGLSADAAVSLLVEQYQLLRSEGGEVEDLQAIVHLRKTCADAQVSPAELRDHLELKAAMTQQGLAVHDVREAVELGRTVNAADLTWEQVQALTNVLTQLRAAGIDVTLVENLQTVLAQYAALGYDAARLTTLAALVSRLNVAGITLDELVQTLDQVHTLCALGLDQEAARALADALHAAGITEQNRAAVVERVVAIGCTDIDHARLERETTATRNRLAELQREVTESQRALAQIREDIARAIAERDGMHREIDTLDQEGVERYNALVTVDALERFLVDHTANNDPLWTTLEVLREMKRRRPAGSSPPTDWLTAEIQQHLRTFLEQLAAKGSVTQMRTEFVAAAAGR